MRSFMPASFSFCVMPYTVVRACRSVVADDVGVHQGVRDVRVRSASLDHQASKGVVPYFNGALHHSVHVMAVARAELVFGPLSAAVLEPCIGGVDTHVYVQT